MQSSERAKCSPATLSLTHTLRCTVAAVLVRSSNCVLPRWLQNDNGLATDDTHSPILQTWIEEGVLVVCRRLYREVIFEVTFDEVVFDKVISNEVTIHLRCSS